MCVCFLFVFFVVFFVVGGEGGRVDECKKSHVRNGRGFAAHLFSWSPKQNCQLRWLHKFSGVRGGLSFTVKYCYYFTETKERNV